MSSEIENSIPLAGLVFPQKSMIRLNRGTVEIVGWAQKSLVQAEGKLVIKVGKRTESTLLQDISLSASKKETVLNRLGFESQSFYLFKKELKVGPGIKVISIFIDSSHGTRIHLGSRTVWQLKRVEWSEPDKTVFLDKGLSDYEKWLILEEPELSAVQFSKVDELIFPQKIVWVVDTCEADDVFRIFRTIECLEALNPEVCEIVLWNKQEVQISELLETWNPHFSAMGISQVGSSQELDHHLRKFNADDWIGFVNAGDLVSARFYSDFCRYSGTHSELELLYTDNDWFDESRGLENPDIRPDWNRDYLHSYPYIGDTYFLKKKAIDQIGGFSGDSNHFHWSLQLKYASQCERKNIGRLCGIYFHKVPRSNPTTSAEWTSSGTEVLKQHFASNNVVCEITPEQNQNGWRVQYEVPDHAPKVSLLIPTRDGVEVLKTTVDSILDKTDYPNFEILILDNDSEKLETLEYFEAIKKRGCKIVPCPGKFNYSQINNRGSMEATGEILGFLNNDLEVIEKDWLTEMVSHTCRKDVGAVGAKLLYPDKRLQHAGVLLGVGHVAAHAHRLFENTPDQGPARAHLISNFSAVTAACLLVRAEIFNEVGGFDDVQLAITNNDVDLCIKIREAGYRNVYTPYAVLFHHESATRGPEDTPEKLNRYQKEVNNMWKKWPDILLNDPAYNLLLTRFKEDFSLASKSELEAYTPGKIF